MTSSTFSLFKPSTISSFSSTFLSSSSLVVRPFFCALICLYWSFLSESFPSTASSMFVLYFLWELTSSVVLMFVSFSVLFWPTNYFANSSIGTPICCLNSRSGSGDRLCAIYENVLLLMRLTVPAGPEFVGLLSMLLIKPIFWSSWSCYVSFICDCLSNPAYLFSQCFNPEFDEQTSSTTICLDWFWVSPPRPSTFYWLSTNNDCKSEA